MVTLPRVPLPRISKHSPERYGEAQPAVAAMKHRHIINPRNCIMDSPFRRCSLLSLGSESWFKDGRLRIAARSEDIDRDQSGVRFGTVVSSLVSLTFLNFFVLKVLKTGYESTPFKVPFLRSSHRHWVSTQKISRFYATHSVARHGSCAQ